MEQGGRRGAAMQTRALYVVFSLAVTVVLLGYLFRTVSLSEVINLVRNLDPRGLFMFLVCSFAAAMCRTWRYALVLGTAGHQPGKAALFLATLVRNTFADLLPARIGSLVYVYIMTTRLGVPFGAAGSSFALSFLFDMLALTPLVALAALAVGTGVGISFGVVAAGAALLAAVTVGLLSILPRATDLAGDLMRLVPLIGEGRRASWRAALQATGESVRLARAAGIYSRLFALSVLVRVFKYASLSVFLFALVAPLGYGFAQLDQPRVFIGLVSSELAASLPISGIAGFGAYEGAWSLVFRLLLFPDHLAKLTSVAHHLFTQVYGYALGIAALVLLLLFPVFKRAPDGAVPVRMSGTAAFYGKLLAFCVGVLLLAGSFYRLVPAAPVRGEPPGLPAAQTQTAPQDPLPVKGWVIYQRPDGIYKTRVESGETVRLAVAGSHPRWSPDGRLIAFLRGSHVMVMSADGSEQRVLAETGEPQCVAFHPSSKAVLFADNTSIRSVSIADRSVRTVLTGFAFRELDMAPDGKLVATIKDFAGFHLRAFNLITGRNWRLAGGCSASLSPDGRLVTQNSGDHRRVYLRDWEHGAPVATLDSPAGLSFDNQFWANDPDWITSASHGKLREIFIHRVSTNQSWRVTYAGSADRADLYVTER